MGESKQQIWILGLILPMHKMNGCGAAGAM